MTNTTLLENNRSHFTLEFSSADTLMLADSLQLAATRAMMCGSDLAKDRLLELSRTFRLSSPLRPDYQGYGYDWYLACAAAEAADTVEVYPVHLRGEFHSDRHQVCVKVDGTEFLIGERLDKKEAEAAAVAMSAAISGLRSGERIAVRFDAMDILVMADALQLAATRAMMCDGKGAKDRLLELSRVFSERSPLSKLYRGCGYEFLHVCEAIRSAQVIDIYYDCLRRPHRMDAHHVCIEVDSEVHRLGENIPEDEARRATEAMSDFVSEIAPMDAIILLPIEVRHSFPEDGRNRWSENALLESAAEILATVMEGQSVVVALRSCRCIYADEGDIAAMTLAVPASSVELVQNLFKSEADMEPDAKCRP